MAVAHLARFRNALPEVFQNHLLPPGLDDYEVVPVDVLEDPTSDPVGPESDDLLQDAETRFGYREHRVNELGEYETGWIHEAGDRPAHPGGLVGRWRGSPTPPADALAFYLPFHFHHPTWWGIYLLYEGVEWLRRYIELESGGVVSSGSAFRLARMFLYGHEQFHHIAECFSTRLESTHREPLYREGIWKRYQLTWGSDECTEEALANAFGYRKALNFGRTLPVGERNAALNALGEFILASPPGYRLGMDYLYESRFDSKRRDLAEEYHHAALPKIKQLHADIWRASPHAFSGIARITSRVNYLVRRNSPLASRAALGGLPIRYREVAQTLRRIGSMYSGPGRGSHEKWRSANGDLFVVPRHPGDMKVGTLRSIFASAGYQMPASEIKRFIDSASPHGGGPS